MESPLPERDRARRGETACAHVGDVVMVGGAQTKRRQRDDPTVIAPHLAPAAGWSRQPLRIPTLICRREKLGAAPYLTPEVATAVAAAGTAISETLIWISSFTPTPR